jgi:hypothetical protein
MTTLLAPSPADALAAGVAGMSKVISSLTSDESTAAAASGDGSAALDPALWARAYEAAKIYRDHLLLSFARATRDAWRSDIGQAAGIDPSQLATIAQTALSLRLGVALDFGFRFLTPNKVAFLGDALVLAFESDLTKDEIVKEIALMAARSPYSSKPKIDALVLGATGMYRFRPDRLIALS